MNKFDLNQIKFRKGNFESCRKQKKISQAKFDLIQIKFDTNTTLNKTNKHVRHYSTSTPMSNHP